MNAGMLWLDDDKQRPLEERVSRAADYYREKYGRLPELCLAACRKKSNRTQISRINTDFLMFLG